MNSLIHLKSKYSKKVGNSCSFGYYKDIIKGCDESCGVSSWGLSLCSCCCTGALLQQQLLVAMQQRRVLPQDRSCPAEKRDGATLYDFFTASNPQTFIQSRQFFLQSSAPSSRLTISSVPPLSY